MLIGLVAALSACSALPQPSGDAILPNFEALPKALATLPRTPTPDPAVQAATRDTHTPMPSLTPSATSTATPVRGVFMGAATAPLGTPSTRSSLQAPLIITQPSLATTRQAANPISGVNVPLIGANPPPAPIAPSGQCSVPIAAPFVRAASDPNIRPRLGCPRAEPISLTIVTQPFERGLMFWRDTREIYVLALQARGAAANTAWKFTDGWTEAQPERDPSLQPPEPLLQPIRGFGAIWRANPAVREALGWAVAAEQPYNGLWQVFEGGLMLSGNDGTVYAVAVDTNAPTAIGVHFGALSP
ncbi:MAG: hypothetical protein CUN49_01745 [Candidatus Thermofonsia Clade 1 bacterium]|jgi:hypothetical protein|uniref:Uncharacterized protein n=1 Tax=Candidatus Thermofonsia Clade 1 bacterium TaxID=2364210 RepID=A0A2M8PHZ5_9CHLR|nr:MAG: hypothetical protein CUN49_01745 [Candidatus Thermofonsia Clade 1 bacterium]RMF52601.1 MAG: hypothetical protein D6749_04460 [Chloroflexota bacterium]